jgi:hypothetical protein
MLSCIYQLRLAFGMLHMRRCLACVHMCRRYVELLACVHICRRYVELLAWVHMCRRAEEEEGGKTDGQTDRRILTLYLPDALNLPHIRGSSSSHIRPLVYLSKNCVCVCVCVCGNISMWLLVYLSIKQIVCMGIWAF